MNLDVKKAIKCFEFFLKNHNCFDRYLINCTINNNNSNFNKYFDYKNIYYKSDLYALIDVAFDWGKTIEGFRYWHAINEEWTKIAYRDNFLDLFDNLEINKQKLIRFLKEYDAFNEYIKLVPINKLNILLLFPFNMIDRSFLYSKTIKGCKFWAFINNEWNKIIYDEFIVND